MKRICSFCKKYLGEKAPYDDKRITHGICRKCKLKMRVEIKKLRHRLKSKRK